MTDVDPGMTIVARRSSVQPLRLVWLFVSSVVVSGVIASALYAGLYVAQDIRRGDAGAVPPGDVQLPAGLELLTPLADAAVFEQAVGFAPVVPQTLPTGTSSATRFDATRADSAGARSGEVRYEAQRGADGVALGPSLLLVETKDAGAALDPVVRTVGDRAFAAGVRCGTVAVEARVYFGPSVDAAESTGIAQRFVDALAAQCAG